MLLSEADSCWVRTEADSGTTRGRPPVFTDEVLDQAAGYSYARRVRTRRGAQDLVYRMFAIAALEHFCEAYPEKEATLAWLLRPKRRHALLTELGRVAQPRSDTAWRAELERGGRFPSHFDRPYRGGGTPIDEGGGRDDPRHSPSRWDSVAA